MKCCVVRCGDNGSKMNRCYGWNANFMWAHGVCECASDSCKELKAEQGSAAAQLDVASPSLVMRTAEGCITDIIILFRNVCTSSGRSACQRSMG